ncbi:MAG: AAA family ATPase [Alphaproteobacteria bacterium]|nr:AAA family ATPase [Alphaproteobacteria bacterium]
MHTITNEGANFLKCDFKTCSPRDTDWQGELLQRSDAEATDRQIDKARQSWAATFVDACLMVGLQAVALTDKHDMVMAHYVKDEIFRRISRGQRCSLWFFPGLRLCLRDAAECILLFDAGLPKDKWYKALEVLGIKPDEEDVAASFSRFSSQTLDFDYDNINAVLNGIPEVKGRFIVLPNVSEGKEQSVVKYDMHNRFTTMPYVGGYVDDRQSVENISEGHLKRLSGNDDQWGTKLVYPLPVSNCDSDENGFSLLGSNNVWIKMSAPTVEAIRQAFLSQKSRIRLYQPKVPNIRIRSVTVTGTNPLLDTMVELNAGYNAVIGGRGSGKSSMLEYIAFGLGRSCVDINKSNYDGSARLTSLLQDTFLNNNAAISLKIIYDNAEFTIKRRHETDYQPEVTYPDGNVSFISLKELRALFPIDIYCQGELSELGRKKGEELDFAGVLNFVRAPYKREYDDCIQEVEVISHGVQEKFSLLQQYWRLAIEKHRTEIQTRSIRYRIDALQMANNVLSDEDKEVISSFSKNVEVGYWLNSIAEKPRQLKTEIVKLISKYNAVLDYRGRTDNARAIDVVEKSKHMIGSSLYHMDIAIRQMDENEKEFDRLLSHWATYVKGTENAQETVFKQAGASEEVSDLVRHLHAALADKTELYGRLKEELNAFGSPDKDVATSRNLLIKAVKKMNARLIEWGKELEHLSDGLLKVNVIPDADKSEIYEALTILSEGSSSSAEYRERKFEELLAKKGDCLEVMRMLCNEIVSVVKSRFLHDDTTGDFTQVCPFLTEILSDDESISNQILRSIDEAKTIPLIKAMPVSRVEFLFRTGRSSIPFFKASEGQRAAALLMMLLKQSGGPMIIDQPEGDLDNEIITHVTELIHGAKERRQILFVTHNANMVVNGAAELVVHMQTTENGSREVANLGSIDIPNVKSAITNTIEGGEKAFKDRKEKYGY